MLSRRALLGAGAGVLAVGCLLPGRNHARKQQPASTRHAGVNAWVLVDEQSRIHVIAACAEMGQGIHTLLAMLVAEELDVDPLQIAVEAAPVDGLYDNPVFGTQITGGSTSAITSFEPLRRAGAQARIMLLKAAADRWRCPVDECETANGVVRHRGSGRTVSFGAVAKDASRLKPPADVVLRPRGAWRVLGKPAGRLGAQDRIRGLTRFGADIRLPDMLYATARNGPVPGGRLSGIDDTRARALPGVVRIVPLEDAVVVVATSTWAAFRAAGALGLAVDVDASGESGAGTIDQSLDAALAGQHRLVAAASREAATAERTLTLRFRVPPLAHASLEPPCATVAIGEDRVDVWAPTQAQTLARDMVAETLGVAPESVHIHTTPIGGSFGRKLYPDCVRQAALAARAVGRPVKLTWSRAEDLTQDFYRPPATTQIEIGLDSASRLVSWVQRLAVPGLDAPVDHGSQRRTDVDRYAVEGAARLPYAIPHHHLSWHDAKVPIRLGWWRSVGHSFNAWFVEHALDVAARQIGRDPYELRWSLLSHQPRHRAVLQALRPSLRASAAPGRFRGLAVHECYGSVVAQIAEVSLEGGSIRVHRIVCAADCGVVLDPNGARAQIEGGIVFGLTATLYGEITLHDGRVQQGNFDSYRLMTLGETPEIEVLLLESDEPPGGVGEISVPPVAPAVCNAILAATGRVIERLPIRRL